MSASRDKDQKDFDLEQIVGIIDTALESDDQRIKDALRKLMTITVLCTAEHPDQAFKGPLARLIEDHNNLNRRLCMVEDDIRKIQWNQQKSQVEPFTPPYNPGSPFGPNPTTGWPGTNDPTKSTPKFGPGWTSSDVGDLPDLKKWTAGDDPNYKGSSASTSVAEDFIKRLEQQ